MEFTLFSKVEFEIYDPIALIECYCIQSDFYKNYDRLLPNREIADVNEIGARIPKTKLKDCIEVVESGNNLAIFQYDIDSFLALDDSIIESHVGGVSEVISSLMKINGIGFSKATKILHTCYPGIIPMIDNPLQSEYQRINTKWHGESYRILFDYYMNLKKEPNKQNLDSVYKEISEHVPHLTKIRIFDILWWSFLKAKSLENENQNIHWSTIKWR